jgi:hypothetical protein
MMFSNKIMTSALAGLLVTTAPGLALAAGVPTEEGVLIATKVAERCKDTLDTAALAAAVEKGTAIALAAEEYDSGFGDTESEMHMTLYNRHGESATRDLRQRALEMEGLDVGDKSMVIFDRPRDVAGTAMLTFSKVLEADDQWMYMPAIKRVKRISSKNKSGPFMGSEFAFEDFSGQEFGKYAYRFLREEACPGAEDLMCAVVERYPLYENSGYVKQIGWSDDMHRNYRTEFYNRRCDLLKILTASDFRQYLDHYWRAHKLRMENQLTGKATDLTWDTFKFGVGLSESDFNQNSLKRAR